MDSEQGEVINSKQPPAKKPSALKSKEKEKEKDKEDENVDF
jgi:hypothetical protein